MAIEDVYFRSETDVVTFLGNQISFSSSLAQRLGLDIYDYIRIGVDPELRRVYFAFQKEPMPGIAKLYSSKGGSEKRKMFSASGLYSKYDWIKTIKTHKEQGKKQFILEEVDHSDAEIFPKYKYFITIGYSWSEERNFSDPTLYPESTPPFQMLILLLRT